MAEKTRYKKNICWIQAEGFFYPYQLRHRQAEVLRLTGGWQQARELEEENLRFAGLALKPELSADCKVFLSGLLSNLSQYQAALPLAREALEHHCSQNNIQGQCQALLALVEAHKQMGEYQEVCDHCRRIIELAQAAGIDNLVARALRNLGIIHLRQGKYAEAQKYFEQDMSICRKQGDLQGQARANGNMGLVYDYQGDSRQSIACQQNKLDICIKIGDKQGVAYANMSLGTVYVKLNQLAQARELFQKSLETSWELGDIRNICLACGNLSAVCLETGDYERALTYSQQQLLGAEETKDKFNQLFALGNMGAIYRRLKQETKAEECFDRAISLCRETGQQHDLAINLHDKAVLCFSRKMYTESEQLNNEALEIASEIHVRNVLSPARLLKAKLAAVTNANEGMIQMQKALNESQDYEEMAPLNLELFKLTGDQTYKKTALSLYTMLNSKSARIEYQEALDDLNRKEIFEVPLP
jgi:tetratricopeptide (TPR) repeat protein